MNNLTAVKSDVIRYLKHAHGHFDFIFADPPYDLKILHEIHELVFSKQLLKANGYLVMEHASREDYSTLPHFEFMRSYGNVGFSFFPNLVPTA